MIQCNLHTTATTLSPCVASPVRCCVLNAEQGAWPWRYERVCLVERFALCNQIATLSDALVPTGECPTRCLCGMSDRTPDRLNQRLHSTLSNHVRLLSCASTPMSQEFAIIEARTTMAHRADGHGGVCVRPVTRSGKGVSPLGRRPARGFADRAHGGRACGSRQTALAQVGEGFHRPFSRGRGFRHRPRPQRSLSRDAATARRAYRNRAPELQHFLVGVERARVDADTDPNICSILFHVATPSDVGDMVDVALATYTVAGGVKQPTDGTKVFEEYVLDLKRGRKATGPSGDTPTHKQS